MKKSKKFSSLLLSLVMMLSLVSVPAMADDLAATTLTPVADAYAGGSTGPDVFPSGTILRLGKNYTKSPVVDWKNGNYVVAVAYDVTSVFATLEANPGYAIKSVKFNPNVGAGWNLGSVSGLKLNFYPVNAKWSEVSTEGYYQFTKENIDKILPIVSSSKGSSATFLNTPAVSLSAAASTGAKSFDITSLFKLHQTTNQNTDLQNFFSFVIEPTASAGNFEYDLKSKESGTGAALVVEYFKPEALTLASSVYPDRPQDDVVLTFSNYIDSATATVNGADVDAQCISIADKTVTIDYSFAQSTEYVVAVTATDSYGSSLTTTHTFTTGRDTTDGSTSLAGAALISANAAPTAGGSVSKWAGANVNYNNPYAPNNFDLMVYKLGLPSVSAGAYIEKASLIFPAWGGTSTTTIENNLRLFKLPGEAWDLTTMKSSDTVAAAYLSDYDAYSAENGVAFKSASTGAWNDGRIYEADITDYVNECIAAQQSYLYIAVTAENETAKLAGSTYGYGSPAHIEYTVNNAPALEFVNASATVNGATLSAFSFDVLTSFDKAALESKVSLQDASGKVVDDAEFVYASGTVSLKAPVVLDEEATYKVVVEIGTQDKFGNSVTAEDSVVYEFATTKNFVIADPILVSASTEIENTTDFASLTSLTEVADAKAVTSFTNKLATTKHIYVAAASYNANGELLAVSMDDVSISAGATYTVASSAISAEGAATIKAFVWDYSDQITPLAASCTIGAAR